MWERPVQIPSSRPDQPFYRFELTVVAFELVTDNSRRFVTANATAGVTLARPSMVGLQIDDITAEYGRPLVPELWDVFDTNGSMSGEYDCDRPGQTRSDFHSTGSGVARSRISRLGTSTPA